MCASSQPAATTVDRIDSQATGIRNLQVGPVTYNVDFKRGSTADIYGNPPDFDIANVADAAEATVLVNEALNEAGGIESVGAPGHDGSPFFFVGYGQKLDGPLTFTSVWEGCYATDIGPEALWIKQPDPDGLPPDAVRIFADFTVVPVAGAV